MRETRATMTELRQNLADLINRAAYGGERVVLVSHGEPKAAIIGIEDLRRLEQTSAEHDDRAEQWARALTEADRVCEKIRQWQEANNIVPESVSETLERLREERDAEISGLR